MCVKSRSRHSTFGLTVYFEIRSLSKWYPSLMAINSLIFFGLNSNMMQVTVIKLKNTVIIAFICSNKYQFSVQGHQNDVKLPLVCHFYDRLIWKKTFPIIGINNECFVPKNSAVHVTVTDKKPIIQNFLHEFLGEVNNTWPKMDSDGLSKPF